MKDGIRSNRPGNYNIIYNNTVSPDINNKFGPWNGPFDQFGTVIVNNESKDEVMAKPEVIQINNEFLKTKSRKVKKPFVNDFPNYIGALKDKKAPFKTGHDFKNPLKDYNAEPLPFIRNHVKNGSFSYATTYRETKGKYRNELSFWTVTNAKNVTVPNFPGFNFPTNPEDRFSIHGNSLMLSGNESAGVQQDLKTLLGKRAYKLGTYVKTKDKAEVRIQITQKGKVIAEISTKDIRYSENSNWKFVQLDFKLKKDTKDLQLQILKLDGGTAYVDNVGILPIPLME
jgi:hypothetical protein